MVAHAAVVTTYPVNAAPLIRGDPIDIQVVIREAGVPIDIAGWTWRSQIRATFDGPIVATFGVGAGEGPGQLILHLDDTDSADLNGGEVFDLEQLTPIHRTLWVVTRLNIQRDVSRDV